MFLKNNRGFIYTLIVIFVVASIPVVYYLSNPKFQFDVDTTVIDLWDVLSGKASVASEHLATDGPVIFCSYDTVYARLDRTEGERRNNLLKFFKFGDSPLTSNVILKRKGAVYQIYMPVKKGSENNPEEVKKFQDLANTLSDTVFEFQPVEIHMSDDFFNTLKVVPMKPRPS